MFYSTEVETMDEAIQHTKQFLTWLFTFIVDGATFIYMFSNADIVFKAIVAVPMSIWTTWKFYCEYQDRKDRKNKK